jgi:hypothetical protein
MYLQDELYLFVQINVPIKHQEYFKDKSFLNPINIYNI